MGHKVHHAIVVTSWDTKLIQEAYDAARQIGLDVSAMVESPVNFYWTFCVVPDGSKSWWDNSARGDARRDEFIKWLRGKQYPDGSSSIEWVEVQYGSDDRDAFVTRSQWSQGGAQ